MMERTAIIDPTGRYRYRLGRVWDPLIPRLCCFVMLNPSTANAEVDDPTIRRCIGFAKSWGFGALEVVNLFAYRATDPRELKRVHGPVGPENDYHIASVISDPRCELVVAAWGNDGGRTPADRHFRENHCRDAKCLGKTKAGYPRHPLYVPSSAELVPL